MSEKEGFLYRNLKAIEDNVFGAIVGSIILGGAISYGINAYSVYKKEQTEQARIQAGYKIQTKDINGNSSLDKFYIINGKPAIVELDGKPVVRNQTIDDKVNN